MGTSSNQVVNCAIVKLQTELEIKAAKEWPQKWDFQLDFDKLLLDEAQKRGITPDEYRKRTIKRKPKGLVEPDIWKVVPSDHVPSTSSGVIGWRAWKEYTLEKFGPLYVSPKSTLPKEHSQYTIFLG